MKLDARSQGSSPGFVPCISPCNMASGQQPESLITPTHHRPSFMRVGGWLTPLVGLLLVLLLGRGDLLLGLELLLRWDLLSVLVRLNMCGLGLLGNLRKFVAGLGLASLWAGGAGSGGLGLAVLDERDNEKDQSGYKEKPRQSSNTSSALDAAGGRVVPVGIDGTGIDAAVALDRAQRAPIGGKGGPGGEPENDAGDFDTAKGRKGKWVSKVRTQPVREVGADKNKQERTAGPSNCRRWGTGGC